MRLKDWIKKQNISISLFAKKLGVSHGHIYRYLNGNSRIRHNLAIKIEELTKGYISREEAMWPEKHNPDYIYIGRNEH